MKHAALVLLALASCKDDRASKAQEQFDRAVERSVGIERDKEGRHGGLPPEPPETDVTRGQYEEYKGNKDKAKALYDKACTEKVPGGCAYAVMLRRENDPDAAADDAKKLCDAGDGVGCYVLGMFYETVQLKTKHDASEVIALYDKGCAAGSFDACNTLGMVYHSGRGGAPKDKAKAVDALTRGCELGDRQSCLQIQMVLR